MNLTDLALGQKLRIAVMSNPPGGTTDSGISAAIEKAAAALSDAGHDVVSATPPDYEEVVQLWVALLLGDLRVQRPILDMVMGEGGKVLLDNFDASAPPMGPNELLGLHARRFALMRSWSSFYAEYPILLSPTWAQPAFAHDADLEPGDALLNTIRPVLPANFLGTPAAVVPAGIANGLPVGCQVMGDRFTDLRCLAVAAQIEAALGRITPIDPVL